MTYPFNIHCHTHFSDGASMADMLRAARVAGHTCLVTSDHDYDMTPEKYRVELDYAAQLAEEPQFPIICGLEISLWWEEAVLLGTEACLQWMSFRENKKANFYAEHGVGPDRAVRPWITVDDVVGFFTNLEPDYALCLVHPGLREADKIQEVYSLFDAYEIMNAGSDWPPEAIARMERLMPGARKVRGLDAHSPRYFECPCNEIDEPILNEQQAIRWVKQLD